MEARTRRAGTAVEAIVAVDGVSVRYGRRVALETVSLVVPRGSVYALLGRNGAGKSSLVRCLLGQMRPARGRIRLLGLDAWKERVRVMTRTGVVAEEPDAPPSMTAPRLAAFCGRLYAAWDSESVLARLRRFDIPRDVPYGRLSKGQKRLVSLALALGHRPELLILDDPTLGLDVAARRALYEEVVGELADRRATILITTHDLVGVEGIADRVGILQNGRLLVDEDLETLKERYRGSSAALEEIFLAETGRRSEEAAEDAS